MLHDLVGALLAVHLVAELPQEEELRVVAVELLVHLPEKQLERLDAVVEGEREEVFELLRILFSRHINNDSLSRQVRVQALQGHSPKGLQLGYTGHQERLLLLLGALRDCSEGGRVRGAGSVPGLAFGHSWRLHVGLLGSTLLRG